MIKGYAAHEKEIFTKVTEARSVAMDSENDSHTRMISERVLTHETPKMIAIAESYPEIRVDEHFVWLQRNLTEISRAGSSC